MVFDQVFERCPDNASELHAGLFGGRLWVDVSMTEEDMVASEKRFLRFNPSRLFFAEISIFQNCFISLQRP
jgi:hypothetical protein